MTLWGKVNIIKMTATPQINYITEMLSTSMPEQLVTYEKMIKQSLWSVKNSAIDK